jgi:hypothetical protein
MLPSESDSRDDVLAKDNQFGLFIAGLVVLPTFKDRL